MRYATMLGRLANGFESDRGRLVHAIVPREIRRPPCPFNEWGRRRDPANDTVTSEVALCGAKPGPRSIGWTDEVLGVATCPRCRAALAKEGA